MTSGLRSPDLKAKTLPTPSSTPSPVTGALPG